MSDFVSKYTEDIKYAKICSSNAYDKETNPTGYINFGSAVNDRIYPEITREDIWSCNTSMIQYRKDDGSPKLRKALAKAFTELLESHEPISPEDLFCATDAESCLDIMIHCFADPGDVFLVPTPMYGRIYTCLKERSGVDIVPIPIITEGNTEDCPALTIQKVIKAYDRASDRYVRGILLINPSNPLGEIYSQQLLMDILSFCSDNSLHVIVDEVHALSTCSESENFQSVLTLPYIPDPERTHVLYGISEGMGGLKIGAIHTKCEPLKEVLIRLCYGQNTQFPMKNTVTKYLENTKWLKKCISTKQERLNSKRNFCVNYLKKTGLKVKSSSTGFSLWVDFRHLCGGLFDEEINFFKYLFEKAHLYVRPGKDFFCAQPGWFRIVFTGSNHHLLEGFKRLEKAVKDYSDLKG